MSGFIVKQPGLLSLIQDRGRFGAHNMGLTTGGPLDPLAYDWANRLLNNTDNASSIEVSFGGLTLQSQVDTVIAITGARKPCKINGKEIEQWQTHSIKAGDVLELGFAQDGIRAYLAVAGGFQIEPSFGSSSTVVREKTGGIHGDKLQAGDNLPCQPGSINTHVKLEQKHQPCYGDQATLRVVKGYQQASFDHLQQ
ncbi:MAG: biotin-dependent carboxyltransferase family protein, partial [Gammaproteobacteria bacterium]|nr:biotin-dependent carboxyltransferase family protein [Gammaproteobacteria bacterium]